MSTEMSKIALEQAWLITWESHDPSKLPRDRLEGILHRRISSLTMLEIAEQIFVRSQFSVTSQMRLIKDGELDGYWATFRYLNDGSFFEDQILCGANDLYLLARRAYNLTISHDQSGVARLTWTEPHVIVEGGERITLFWEEFSLPARED